MDRTRQKNTEKGVTRRSERQKEKRAAQEQMESKSEKRSGNVWDNKLEGKATYKMKCGKCITRAMGQLGLKCENIYYY